jgi:hypothetical protein
MMWNKGREPVTKTVLKAKNPRLVPQEQLGLIFFSPEVALLNPPEVYHQ